MRKLALIYSCIALPIAVVLVWYVILQSTIHKRDAARRTMIMAEMKQIGLAIDLFDSQTGNMPTRAIRDKQGNALLSWRVAILPELDHDALYKEFHLDERWDSPHNRALIAKMPDEFGSADDAAAEGKTHFLAIVGKGASFADDGDTAVFGSAGSRADTVFVVEADTAVPWTRPEDLSYAAANPLRGLGQLRAGEFFALFGDGRVGAIPTTTSAALIEGMFAGTTPVDLQTLHSGD